MTSGTENSLQKLSVDNKSEMISTIRDTLIEMAEPEYQHFSSKLLPGVDNILGVRLPKLRKYARQIMKTYGTAYLDTVFDSSYCIAFPNKIFDKSYDTKYLDTIDKKSYRNNSKSRKSDNEFIESMESVNSIESMEEILLQGMVIGQLRPKPDKKFDKADKSGKSDEIANEMTLPQIQDYIRKYVPKINNWSTCDSFCAGLKITKEYPAQMWEFLQEYLASKRAYDVRFGIVMIINYYIQDAYLEKLCEIFDKVGENWNSARRKSLIREKEKEDEKEKKDRKEKEDGKDKENEKEKEYEDEEEEYEEVSRQQAQDLYYVEMALAWAISICYVQYPDRTLSYLEKRRTADTILDDFTYNKALQKIVESHCVSQDKKAEIKIMKRGK